MISRLSFGHITEYTNLFEVVNVAKKYNFFPEYIINLYKEKLGRREFPPLDFFRELKLRLSEFDPDAKLKLALVVQGEWARDILRGDLSVFYDNRNLAGMFTRIQINTYKKTCYIKDNFVFATNLQFHGSNTEITIHINDRGMGKEVSDSIKDEIKNFSRMYELDGVTPPLSYRDVVSHKETMGISYLYPNVFKKALHNLTRTRVSSPQWYEIKGFHEKDSYRSLNPDVINEAMELYTQYKSDFKS